MTDKRSPKNSPANSRLFPVAAGVLWFTAAVLAGLLALTSCASTPQGISREQQLYLAASNSVASAHSLTPYLPAPANTVWEGILGVLGAGLAIWASHLHRSVAELKKNGNGNGNGKALAGLPGQTPPAPPGPQSAGQKAS